MAKPSEPAGALSLPPLTVYVHLPWCVKKCPYCDFNSHAVPGEMPGDEYVRALLSDLEHDLPMVWGRPIHSVFFGGGTPSLFSAEQIDRVLSGIRGRLQLAPGAEVTLEANPGTVERDSFSAYRDAGINRVSLGVQSFDDGALQRIGRIHGRMEVEQAIQSLTDAGLDNFNLDLMYGLPQQTLEAAVEDMRQAMRWQPAHVSHYQLTVEPNTAFHARPPVLPSEDECWEMQKAAAMTLAEHGFRQYEISAWAKTGKACAHNLNYWRYGDYLGIGAGAHSKITLPAQGEIRRLAKQRSPGTYLRGQVQNDWHAENRVVQPKERVFEFFLNQLRLRSGVNTRDFVARTGQDWDTVRDAVGEAIGRGLLQRQEDLLVPTGIGWRFVNEIQALFLPDES